MKIKSIFAFLLGTLLAACAVSPETQALMDEYDRTIPTCSSVAECRVKWDLARAWAEANSDFGIRSSSEDRIVATTNITTNAGIGVVVTRVPMDGGFQILVDMDCLNAYGCPTLWDQMVDFNRVVNGTP